MANTVDFRIKQTDGTEANLTMSDAHDDHAMAVIKGLFGVLGAIAEPTEIVFRAPDPDPVPVKGEPKQPPPVKELAKEIMEKAIQREEKSIREYEKPQPQFQGSPRPQQLPMINAERTLSYTIGEKLRENPPQTEGEWAEYNRAMGNVRQSPGGDLYQTAYNCPECGDQGVRFNAAENKYCKCRKCNTRLKLRPADPRGLPHTDKAGNFFVADTPYEN